MPDSHAPWQPLPPLPEPNGGFVCGAVDGAVVLAGGTNWEGGTKRWLDRIWRFDEARARWVDSGRTPGPLAYPAAGQDGRSLWFAGGTTGSATHRALWTFDAGPKLRQVAALPQGFVYAAGGVIGRTLYVVGGSDDQAKLDRMTNAVFAIELDDGAMRRLADYPEPSLFVGSACTCGDRLFVFGGASWRPAAGELANQADAHAYTPATGRWDRLPSLPAANRGLTVAPLGPRHLLIGGGYHGESGGFTNEALIFDPAAGAYHRTAPLPLAGMVGLVVAGEWLYCLGGEDRARHRSAEAFRIPWREYLPKPA